MPATSLIIPAYDRRSLAQQAMKAAISARAKTDLDQQSPICIYGLCEALGVTVRFNDINMEGMYEKSDKPRIHLSSKRPLVRRAYNCAHELGHHVFKHGFSVDELQERAKESSWEDPKEFLADTFAGFVLMPILGLRQAFARRGWDATTASPVQLYAIACEFGVGYSTLLTHLSAGVGLISHARATVLKRTNPKGIRAEILGEVNPDYLIVADRHRLAPTIDLEVDTHLLLPEGSEIAGGGMSFERHLPSGPLYRATTSGIHRVVTRDGEWATFVRIAPKGYVGLAQYRHLEEDLDD